MVEAEDCPTVVPAGGIIDPNICKYININVALDERIIIFYLWYEIHTGMSVWNSDHRGVSKVFTNYGWIPPVSTGPLTYIDQWDPQVIAQPIQISVNCESKPVVGNVDKKLGLKDMTFYKEEGVIKKIPIEVIQCSMDPCINMKCTMQTARIIYLDGQG